MTKKRGEAEVDDIDAGFELATNMEPLHSLLRGPSSPIAMDDLRTRLLQRSEEISFEVSHAESHLTEISNSLESAKRNLSFLRRIPGSSRWGLVIAVAMVFIAL